MSTRKENKIEVGDLEISVRPSFDSGKEVLVQGMSISPGSPLEEGEVVVVHVVRLDVLVRDPEAAKAQEQPAKVAQEPGTGDAEPPGHCGTQGA